MIGANVAGTVMRRITMRSQPEQNCDRAVSSVSFRPAIVMLAVVGIMIGAGIVAAAVPEPVKVGERGVVACRDPGEVQKQLRMLEQRDDAAFRIARSRALGTGDCVEWKAGAEVHVDVQCLSRLVVRVRRAGSPDELWAYVGELLTERQVSERMLALVGTGVRC